MKYYIIAGEASGDLHASNLVKALKARDEEAVFRAWGGDMMKDAGVELTKHIRELAFMGFVEVLMNIRTILGNIKLCKKDILQWRPDVLILVDYPGFNLRIAKWASQNNIRVVYYISPQIWAWHESRVHQIKKYVDQMLVILPFEEEFYARYNYPVSFVGHPLLDVILEGENVSDRANDPVKTIALLPGSRRQEIKRILRTMLATTRRFPEYRFAIACAPAIPDDFYDALLDGFPEVGRYRGSSYTLLNEAYAALVTSGTATLETALFGVPQVVCYKGDKLSYLIARRLITIKYISLVNLIMDREVVKELIQDEMNEAMLSEELKKLAQPDVRNRIQSDYILLRKILGNQGASGRAADAIIQNMPGR